MVLVLLGQMEQQQMMQPQPMMQPIIMQAPAPQQTIAPINITNTQVAGPTVIEVSRWLLITGLVK